LTELTELNLSYKQLSTTRKKRTSIIYFR